MNMNSPELKTNPLDLIFRIVQNIEAPLSSLIEESNKINTFQRSEITSTDSKDIIFTNSLEIKELIDQVLTHIKSNQEPEPLIFEIYRNNQSVQDLCNGIIDPGKISKQDVAWLIDLENEVYKNVDKWAIHLSDLSYSLAVSKRKLYRKVQGLLHLTPNKYIRVLKLHKAKQLIDEFRYDTISQVSYAVGYYDTHYFSKLFSCQYDISPKELLDSKR